ncbi:YcjF family protein [Helicobacter canis]|uniref:YcjF family protein n=1 Tax=Helicobacter canis TaxID=29419 RepID=UPI0026EAD121|nr:DUF697 domain-containing protein [Helicobacter canis]
MPNTQASEVDLLAAFLQAQIVYKEVNEATKSKLNILIVGKTGYGKSTLINTIFGEKLAQSGTGKPITQEITRYTSAKQPDLAIYDSRGLELGNPSTITNIESFLQENHKREPNMQIHIVWFCIAEPSRRLEDAEIELFKAIKQHNLPLVAVITKASQDKDENGQSFKAFVQGKLSIDESKVVRTRALEIEDDDGNLQKPRGIDELLEQSYKYMDKGKANALARFQNYNKEQQHKANIAHAKSLVNRYAASCSAAAVTPIPFSDIAILTPIQIGMILHISNIFGINISKENAAKLVATLLSVVGAAFAVRFGVQLLGNVLKLIPGAGSVAGGAINATIAAGTTKVMGNAYIAYLDSNVNHLTSLVTDISPEVFSDFVNKAKADYDKNPDKE